MTRDEVLEELSKSGEKSRRAVLVKYFGGCCQVCKTDLAHALEFHHVGKKRFSLNISSLRAIVDAELILEEAERCLLVCSNCHKGIHAGVIDVAGCDCKASSEHGEGE